jgi:hypothetical protein
MHGLLPDPTIQVDRKRAAIGPDIATGWPMVIGHPVGLVS